MKIPKNNNDILLSLLWHIFSLGQRISSQKCLICSCKKSERINELTELIWTETNIFRFYYSSEKPHAIYIYTPQPEQQNQKPMECCGKACSQSACSIRIWGDQSEGGNEFCSVVPLFFNHLHGLDKELCYRT